MNKIELTLVAVSLLILISGLAKATRDHIAHHGGMPRWGLWWTLEGWKNKWKNGNSEMGEAFPGSSTIFVFITDGWHFFDTIDMFSMALSVAATMGFVFNLKITAILILAFSIFAFKAVVFHILYNTLNKKTK